MASGAEIAGWVERISGHRPKSPALFERALSHSSAGPVSYERLEFLGDRVLGLSVAKWLFERFPDEPEGNLSRRYNVLVARETCADVGRTLGVPPLIKLGKQAREDGATTSDNVIGDCVEALLGALLIDGGIDVADRFVRKAWAPYVESQKRAPHHPKSQLQELAAAKGLKAPEYVLVSRLGLHHAPTFRVKVTLARLGEAEAEGSSKQDAETAAAAALLETLG